MEGRENPDMDKMGGSAQGPSHFSLEARNSILEILNHLVSSNDRFCIDSLLLRFIAAQSIRTMAQPEPPPHPPPQLSPRAEPQVVTIEETMDERLGGVNSCGRKFLSYCKTNGIKPEENIPKVDIKFKVCTFHFHLFTSTS